MILLIALLLSAVVPIHGQDGYTIWRGQIQVEGRDHWEAWEGVPVARRIVEDGVLRPRFLRKHIKACLDAPSFENRFGNGRFTRAAGVWDIGSGQRAAAEGIIDGDEETYWQPTIKTQDVEKHWVEINLGRGVIAERVNVRFADSGDPFRTFRVLASDGEASFGIERERRYWRIGVEGAPNKTRRGFSYEVLPQRTYADGVSGEAVQYVRIEMLSTDGPRGELVSAEQYQALPPEQRGAIDHYLRSATGREVRVVEPTWLELPDEERGPVRHYRWELPRLAEVEVIAAGDNVVGLTQSAEFREGSFFDDIARRFITDGLYSTGYFLRAFDPIRDRNQMLIDLGARFWIDRLRMVSLRNPPTSYQFRISDGADAVTGQRSWTTFDERLNRERYLQIEETFSMRPVRFIEMRRLDLDTVDDDQGELVELLGFGEGYVSDMTMTSPIIHLQDRTMFGRLNWDGVAPPGTAVDVRTRSGDEIILEYHYYTKDGVEVPAAGWESLRTFEKGPIVIKEFPAPGWSPWSAVYGSKSEPFASPMPRRYTQIQVRLRTSQPLRAAEVHRLSIDLTSPLVEKVLAEVWPLRGVEPGEWTTFRLYVRLQPDDGDAGLHRLRVHTTSSTPMRLLSVQSGDDGQLRFGRGQSLVPGSATVSHGDDGSVEIAFAEPLGRRETRLELTLEAKMFLPGTTFGLSMYNDDRPSLVQHADPGPASSLVSSSSLTVAAQVDGGRLLEQLVADPVVITPNGDGINDETTIHIVVYQLTGARRIHVGVFDLAGRRVRDLSVDRDHPSGEHTLVWDGRDAGGRHVPPGTYVITASVDTDRRGRLRQFNTVSVVY